MGYQKRDISQEKSYLDSSSASFGYFLPEYRPMMFYSPTEHETLAGIKYGQIRVDYDQGFSEFASSLRGELPARYFGIVSDDNEARFAPPMPEQLTEPELILKSMRSKASEEIRNELIEAHMQALNKGKDVKSALENIKSVRITDLYLEHDETIVIKRRTKIKARKVFIDM